MTDEELEAIRARVADDVVLPTATTLALIDALKAARAGWAGASSLATVLSAREADLLRERSSAFRCGAEAMREAAVAVAGKRADLPTQSDADAAWCRSARCIEEELRTLPIPEDK